MQLDLPARELAIVTDKIAGLGCLKQLDNALHRVLGEKRGVGASHVLEEEDVSMVVLAGDDLECSQSGSIPDP